jgi:multiple sugar transport system substrate-binding protein
MRRYGVIFLITSLLLMVITSIAAGEEKPYQGSTVRVLLEDTPWHRNIESAIPKFQEQTGISVFMEFLPSESERERTNLDLTTGAGSYDVFLTDQMFIQKFVKMDVLEPLNQFIENPDFNQPEEYVLDDYEEAVLGLATYNDQLYALPWRQAALVFMYRKDLFEKYGVEVPTTMDELYQAAQKIHTGLRNDGVTDIYAITLRGLRGEGNNVYIWAGAFLPAFGLVDWFDENGKCQLNNDKALAATKLYVDLVRNFGPPDTPAMNWDHCWQFFQQGKAAMWIDSAVLGGYVADPTQSPVADKVGYAMVPAGPAGIPNGGAYQPAYVMSKSARDKGAAWEFMKMATSREQMLSDATVGGNFEIASRWVIENPKFAEAFPYPELVDAFLKMREVTTETRPMVFNWPEVGDVVSATLQLAIAGEITPEEAVDRMATSVDRLMSY